ncbi:MAG: 4Fe-4S binding protein [Anaerolineae bacterium]|nr:4Fe-4S binding protein [Anaerolineae bacterium]
MCRSCGEHVAQNLWYLQPANHVSSGVIQDFVDRIMYNGIVVPGLKSISKRQRYGTQRWSGVQLALWNWITKSLHSFQVLPDAESAFKAIDLSNELGLSVCSCAAHLDSSHPQIFRCIGMNNAAKITFKDKSQPFEPLTKQQAKEVVAEWRAKGCYQTIGWRMGPNVTWLCNCDQWCGCHWSPELEWGQIPSFFVARVDFPEKCQGCRECTTWCHRQGALTYNADGVVQIDGALCKGCGLCIEHCPNGVLGYAPRQEYYDVPTLRKMRLPDQGVLAVG